MPETAQLLLSAVIGAAAGAFATAYKSRKELESLYDIELRRRRIDAYADLWKLLEPFAYWSPPRAVTYKTLGDASRALRSWYFARGGLVLSTKTRAPYFNLQEALTRLSAGDRAGSDSLVEEDTLEIVKALASRLRSASTDDVATRVEPSLAGPFGSRLRLPWRSRLSPLRVEIDRRWDFAQNPPAAAFFVILENLSKDELEIEDVTVGDGKLAEVDSKERRFVLQAAEQREVRAPIVAGTLRAGYTPEVTVTLAGNRSVRSRDTPDVPLRTPTLELPRD
jgi:hypothetical protein